MDRPRGRGPIPIPILVLALVLAAGVFSPLSGQDGAPDASPFLSPDHWAHGALLRLSAGDLLSGGFDPGTRSVGRVEAFRAFEYAVAAAGGREPGWRALAAGYRDRFAEEFPGAAGRIREGRTGIGTAGAFAGGLEVRRNGLLARHHREDGEEVVGEGIDDLAGPAGALELGLHLPRRRVSLAGHGAIAFRSESLRASEAYGVLATGPLGFWMGRRPLGFGLAHGEAMIFRGRVPLNGGGLFFTDGIRLPSVLRHLGPLRAEVHVFRLERSGTVEGPWLLALRTSVAPHRRIRIGLNRGTMFGGDGELVPSTTLGRVARVLAAIEMPDDEDRRNYDDHVGSVDFWLQLPLGRVPVVLYGEWGVEDLEAQRDEMPAFIVGSRLPAVPGVPWLSLGFERSSFGAFEDRRSRPWYDHRVFGTWTDRGRLLGGDLGGEGRELRAYGAADLADARLRLEGHLQTRRRGPGNLFAPEREGSSRGGGATARWRLSPALEMEARGALERGEGWRESTGVLQGRVLF